MSIVNIATSDTKSIAVGASGNDRLLVALISQSRNPTLISNVAFDSVAGTQLVTSDDGNTIATIYYWLDADLPASAGTYNLTHSFVFDEVLLYAEGVDQANPIADTKNLVDVQTGGTNVTQPERYVDLSAASVGDLCVHVARRLGSTDGAISGCVDITPDVGSPSSYSLTQTTVGHGEDVTPDEFVAAAFKAATPSATITDIDGDNNVQVGQPSAIITTAGIDPASVTQAVTLGGETLPINSWLSGNFTINAARLDQRLDGAYPAGDAPALTYDLTIDNVTTSNSDPVFTGTCGADVTSVDVAINGVTYGNFPAVSGIWTTKHTNVPRYKFKTYDDGETYSYAAVQGMYNHPDGTMICLYSRSAGHVISNTAWDLYVTTSTDRGKTWSSSTVIPKPSGLYPRGNATFGVTPTGRIVILSTSRDFDNTPDTVLNVWHSYSDDKGQTWQTWTDIKSTIMPASALQTAWQSIVNTPSGLLAIFYGFGTELYEVTYSLSTDDGVTWSAIANAPSLIGYGEPTPICINDKVVLMARATGASDKSSYQAVIGTCASGNITWDTPLSPYTAGFGATTGSPVSLEQVGDNIFYGYSSRKLTDPKQYCGSVTVTDFLADPYKIFQAPTNRQEIQLTTSVNGISNFGYSQMCQIEDASGSEDKVMIAWWEESVTGVTTDQDILMQSFLDVPYPSLSVGQQEIKATSVSGSGSTTTYNYSTTV